MRPEAVAVIDEQNPAGSEPSSPRDAVGALERLRRAQASAGRRHPGRSTPSETDRTAARFILEEAWAGRSVTPTSLARRLGISTASTTGVLHRLERASLVTLQPNPDDRRRKFVLPADITDDPDLYDPAEGRIRDLVDGLSLGDEAVITRFLNGVTAAITQDAAGDD